MDDIGFNLIEKEDYLHFLIKKTYDFNTFMSDLEKIKELSRKKRYNKIIIDLLESDSGNWDIELLDRFNIGLKIVNLFGFPDFAKIALICDKKYYENLVEDVTSKRGVNYKVFFDIKDAIKWLHTFE
jgi:hypothetical protein